jgi:hypothetical protein
VRKVCSRRQHGAYKSVPTMTPKDKLILAMLKTFDDLGSDAMARIDARLWFKHYKRKVKKLGIEVPIEKDNC